jgi:hypothetical protein
MHAKAERELREQEIKPDTYETNLVHVWIVHAPDIASIKY